MRVKVATFAAASALAALLVNHWWVDRQMARFGGGMPGDFGLELPGYVWFLVKLDHFARDYGWILIPFVWLVAFFIAWSWLNLTTFFTRRKADWTPEKWPGES